jgi:cellulose synthase/poly-beta-1,6-N-acetylglucosamine synthase-like glycosyltransferase
MYGLIGSSYAVLLTAILAFGIIAFIVYKKYGTIGDIFSVMRIIGVSLVLYVIASWWQMSGWFLFVQYLVLGVFYVLLLYLFREFGQEDWDLVKRVFER